MTDLGVELASTGIQVLGGVGYSEETRAPQRWRDARIAPIYEGTNGIQAIDLVTRKLTRRDGDLVRGLLDEIGSTVGRRCGRRWPLCGSRRCAARRHRCGRIAPSSGCSPSARATRRTRSAGATTFLGVFGDLVGGWLLAQRVQRRDGDAADEALDVAVFYASERLVTVAGRCATVTAGADRLFI